MRINGALDQARQHRVLSTLIVLALVVGIGVVGGVTTHVFDKDKGPAYPKTWDPRIAPLAAIASKERGLNFKHPVYVDFLADKEFEKEVSADESDLSEEQKQSADDAAGNYRALGYLSGNVDAFKQANDLTGGGIVGLYSHSDKRIRVRGTALTPEVKLTLVHELTHVLQDQTFDIGTTQKNLDTSETKDSWAYQALVEGDASRIEDDYRESLSKADQKALADQEAASSQKIGSRLANIPMMMKVDLSAPYVLGEVVVAAAALGGNSAVDQLFRTPPIHEIQLMQPWLIGKSWKERTFTKPVVPQGAKALGKPHEFGEFYLLLMLIQQQSVPDALAAADGWGGDQAVEYKQNGKSCAAMSFTGQTFPDTQLIFQGLQKWASGIGTAASVRLSDNTVLVKTCDPGTGFRAAPDKSSPALSSLRIRTEVYKYLTEKHASYDLISCYLLAVSHQVDLVQADAAGAGSALVQQMSNIAEGCRSQGQAV